MWLKLASLLIVLNLAILGVVGYMLFAPVTLPVIYNEPFPVSPAVVKKGEQLTYTIHFSKKKEYAVDSHKNIVCADGNLVTLAQNVTNVPLGEHTINVQIIIPQKTSLGECYVEVTNIYHVNPLRDEPQNMRTQNFIVIE